MEADLHSEYGVDVRQPGLLEARDWPWLSARITGLLAVQSRVWRALVPQEPPKPPQ